MSDDILAMLDAELATVTTKISLLERKKSLASKAKGRNIPDAKRLDYAREIAELNQQLEAIQWSVVANVALFSETTCKNCGESQTVFLQFMERLKTNSGPKVARLARIPAPHLGIPNEVQVQASEVEMCYECCGSQGFDPSAAQFIYIDRPVLPGRK